MPQEVIAGSCYLRRLGKLSGHRMAEPQMERPRRLATGTQWLSSLWVTLLGILTASVIGGGHHA